MRSIIRASRRVSWLLCLDIKKQHARLSVYTICFCPLSSIHAHLSAIGVVQAASSSSTMVQDSCAGVHFALQNSIGTSFPSMSWDRIAAPP